MRVAVIHGGTSTEHDVSVASGQGVLAALHRLGHDPIPILVDRAGEWHTPTERGRTHAIATLLTCDVVVPALHGAGGEDGTVQGLLELLGLPYIGSGVRASAVCLDKGLTKALVERAGVAVAPGIAVGRTRVAAAVTSERERSALLLELSHAGVHLPMFVKPAHGGSSIGVTRVTDRAGLRDALVVAGDDAVLVESEVVGLEVDCRSSSSPTARSAADRLCSSRATPPSPSSRRPRSTTATPPGSPSRRPGRPPDPGAPGARRHRVPPLGCSAWPESTSS